jgi:heme oxygenase
VEDFPAAPATGPGTGPTRVSSAPVSPANAQLPQGLAEALRLGTAALHEQAERSGIVREIMRGRVSLAGYALYLRNLLPAYQAMEAGLARHAAMPAFACLPHAGLERAPAMLRDLAVLDPEGKLPLLEAGAAYARQAGLAADSGPELIGHAYARYLGDLSGGQYMLRALVRAAGLPEDCRAFFAFPAIADAASFKARYRAGLVEAGRRLGDTRSVVAAARAAFASNIALSEAVSAALAAGPG